MIQQNPSSTLSSEPRVSNSEGCFEIVAGLVLYMCAILAILFAFITLGALSLPGKTDSLVNVILVIMGVGGEAILLGLALVSGTFTGYRSARRRRQKARDILQLQQAAEQSVASTTLAEANVAVPTFRGLLKHNLFICLFFVPLTSLITYVAWKVFFVPTAHYS